MSELTCPVCGNPCLDTPQSKWVCRCCGAEVISVPIRQNPPAPIKSVAQDIFDLATEHNRELAAFYRLNPPRGR